MFRKLLSGVGAALLTLWLAYSIVFLVVRVVPGDPLRLLVGEQAGAVELQQLRAQLGLDKSLIDQYGDRLVGFAHGDFGTSIVSGQPVVTLLAERLPYTLFLTFLALLVAIAISLPAGVQAGQHPGTIMDLTATTGASLGLAIPNFWLGPLLIMLFALWLGWFPTSWDGEWRGWVLPAVTLGTSLAALLTRVVRAEYVRTSEQDYVRTAVAKGLADRRVAWVHVFLNLLVPVVTILGLQAGALLAGSVVTENIFAVPGLGQLLIDAINQRDYPVVEGCAMWIALVYLGLNLLLDRLYLLLDPRQRYPTA